MSIGFISDKIVGLSQVFVIKRITFLRRRLRITFFTNRHKIEGTISIEVSIVAIGTSSVSLLGVATHSKYFPVNAFSSKHLVISA